MNKQLLALLAVLVLCFAGAAPAHTATVHITGFSFKPGALTVHPGDTVVFQNDDDVTHNVSGDEFKSPDIDAGKSWSYTFSKAGTYAYVCTYHPGMNGTITVSADAK